MRRRLGGTWFVFYGWIAGFLLLSFQGFSKPGKEFLEADPMVFPLEMADSLPLGETVPDGQSYDIIYPDLIRCKLAVRYLVAAINGGGTDSLYAVLSPGFSCMGYEGEMALQYVGALLSRYSEDDASLVRYDLLRDSIGKQGYKMVYEAFYADRKEFSMSNAPAPSFSASNQISFVFDTLSRLSSLEISDISPIVTDPIRRGVVYPLDSLLYVDLDFSGDMLTVKAEINGEEHDFILDNGSPLSMLDAFHVNANDTLRPYVKTRNGVGVGGEDVDFLVLDSFGFAGIRMYAQVMPMKNMLGLDDGGTVWGVIGFDMLKDFDWFLDYESSKMVLIHPDYTRTYIEGQGYGCDSVPLEKVAAHMWTIPFCIDGRQYRMGIDCGTSSNVMDLRIYDSLVGQLKNIYVVEDFGSGMNTGNVQLILAQTKKGSVGKSDFRNVETTFTDISHINRAFDRSIDGLVGYRMFWGKKFVVSYQNACLLLLE